MVQLVRQKAEKQVHVEIEVCGSKAEVHKSGMTCAE